jgi:hypothetical protein
MEQPIITTETIEVKHNVERTLDEKLLTILHGDYEIDIDITINLIDSKTTSSICVRNINHSSDDNEVIVYVETINGQNRASLGNTEIGSTSERTMKEWLYVERIFNHLKSLRAFFK